jgi:hypothetical protein
LIFAWKRPALGFAAVWAAAVFASVFVGDIDSLPNLLLITFRSYVDWRWLRLPPSAQAGPAAHMGPAASGCAEGLAALQGARADRPVYGPRPRQASSAPGPRAGPGRHPRRRRGCGPAPTAPVTGACPACDVRHWPS